MSLLATSTLLLWTALLPMAQRRYEVQAWQMCRRYFVMKWLIALGRGRKTQQSKPCETLSLTPLNTPCKRPCGLVSSMAPSSCSYGCFFSHRGHVSAALHPIAGAPALLAELHMALLQIVACIARGPMCR